jgi:hypothetical protein
MAFVFGNTTMTFTPDDIEAVWKEWEAENPGKIAHRDMSQDEFAKRCRARIRASARPTRTVIHN